jgi:hypothetical protein
MSIAAHSELRHNCDLPATADGKPRLAFFKYRSTTGNHPDQWQGYINQSHI